MANYFDDLLPSSPAPPPRPPASPSPLHVVATVAPFVLRRVAPLAPWNPMAQELGQRIEAAGAALGRSAGNVFDDLLPSPKPSVQGKLVTPPSDAAILLHELPAAMAETLPTEAAKYLTPNALGLNLLLGAGLRGLAGTRLGQFPLEAIRGLGFLRRFGAPQLFEPLTKPRQSNLFEDIIPETVQEAEIMAPPKALPSPETVGKNLFEDILPRPPVPPRGETMTHEEAVRQFREAMGTRTEHVPAPIESAPPPAPSAGAMAHPGYVLTGQPFEGAIAAYEQQAGAGTFDQLSPKAQLAVIARSPAAEPVRDLIRKITGQLPTGRPMQERDALRRLFQREAAVARQAQRFTTAQVLQQVSQMFSEPQRFLQVAQGKFLTPRQVGRMAALYRTHPSSEGPLTQADLAQITRATARLSPRPGQPTGTPPRLPRKRTLVPFYPPGRFRDLNEYQVTQLSGLEPRRVMRVIDRGPNGPTTQRWLALRQGELAAGQEWNQLNSAVLRVAGRVPEASPLAQEITGVLEGTLTAPPSPRAIQTAAWLRQDFDQLLLRINRLRARQGKVPILRRGGYMTHLSSPDLWAELRSMATGEDIAKVKTLGDLVPQALQPSFRFGRPRLGGPYAIDPVKAFQVYSRAALRVIHLSDPATLLKAHAEQLPPLAQRYVRRVIQQSVTGWPGGIAAQTAKPLRRGLGWLTGRFARGTVLGNASSVVMQPWTLPNTMRGLRRPEMAGAAAVWMAQGTGWPFAEQWSTTLQGRLVEGLDPGVLSGYQRLTDKLAGAMTGVDRFMVAHNFLSQYLDEVAAGASHAEAVRIADEATALAQAEFLKTTLAPIFADEVTRGFVVFQTTVNNTFNFVKAEVLAPGQPPAVFWRGAALFAGTMAAMTAVYDALGLPHPGQGRNWQEAVLDWIPGLSAFRGGPPVLRVTTDLLTGLASPRPDERTRAWRGVLRAAGVIAMGPGGNQLIKSVAGIQAVARGGVYNAQGQEKFPITGPAEQGRAMLGGPYQTKAGQAYIRRGFKPAPMTDEQRRVNRRIGAMTRRLHRGR